MDYETMEDTVLRLEKRVSGLEKAVYDLSISDKRIIKKQPQKRKKKCSS